MARDNHEDSEGEGETSPDVESKNKQQRHEPGFGRFETNDEYDYEEGEDEYASDQPPTSEHDDWLKDEHSYSDEQIRSWPVGLIAVAAVALMLLVAGGYGIIQERSATEEELQQLRGTLTTMASVNNTDASRQALQTLQTLQQSYDGLTSSAEALMQENRRLKNTVTELEIQLERRQALRPNSSGSIDTPVLAGATPPESDSADPIAPTLPVPVLATYEPATVKPVADAASGAWFVNVSSYSARAAAEKWAANIRPDAGKVIVAASTTGGKTYYRVRVIGLADKSAATQVARKLETELSLNTLWVGRE
jgi:cell division septation protein DedD